MKFLKILVKKTLIIQFKTSEQIKNSRVFQTSQKKPMITKF